MSLRPSIARFGVLGLAVAVALVINACGGDSAAEPETTTTTTRPTTTTSTTTTTIPPTLSLLTALPVEDESILERPVVAVKIGSDVAARPQHGLETADIVVEELVEGVSRFLAIFQSTDSDPAGPIRSARTSEIDLLPLFGRPIFANSGGNAGTIRALANANTSVQAGHSTSFGNLYFRSPDKPRPHNLYVDTTVLREAAGETAVAPGPLFSFHDGTGEMSPHAVSTIGAEVHFANIRTRWLWDEDRGVFLRFQNTAPGLVPGDPHMGIDGEQLGFENVLIFDTQYRTSPADPGSPEAVTVGSGQALILSGGRAVAAEWSRATPEAPYVLRGVDGGEIQLTPGRIWISLPRAGNVTILDADPRS